MHHLTYPSAWLPLVGGALLLVLCARAGGAAALVLGMPPAVLLIAGGLRSALFTDLRAPQLAAIGAVLCLLLALPLGWLAGAWLGWSALAVGLVAFVAEGWFQIRLRPQLEDVPAPTPDPLYSARVALDDVMLGAMAVLTPRSTPDALGEAVAESREAHALLQELGCTDDPRAFHVAPPAPAAPELSPLRLRGGAGELLRFDSGFEPDARLPGRDRWLACTENRTVPGLVLRGRPDAPWLVCVHGFGMGNSRQDLQAFRARQLHKELGLNIALLTLPVHGERTPQGASNGARFFGLSVMDFVFAESQAIWDLRRLIGWLRSEGASRIGVYGISLGGYTSALLAAVEDDLACVVVAIPPTDMIAHREHLAGSSERRMAAVAGVDPVRDTQVHRVVSPLAMPARVPRDARFLLAASCDQFVPVEQVHALWRHWEEPTTHWVKGGHLSSLMQASGPRFVADALRRSLAGG